jgi:hypothetical protein
VTTNAKKKETNFLIILNQTAVEAVAFTDWDAAAVGM